MKGFVFMNNEEYKKSKKELEKAKEQNNEIIDISDERMRMSKVNSLEYKSGLTLVFSMLAYTVLLLTSKALGASVITSIFPGFTYPIVLIGSSLVIGTVGRVLFDKKFQVKDRLKEFSTAKTQAEKLEEEVHYQIELEKANNRNNAINQSLKDLDSNQILLTKVLRRFNLSDKTAPQSKEEAEKIIDELTTHLKEQYNKLDIFSTKKVLHDRFWKIRQKFQRRIQTMTAIMLSGLFSMAFCSFPIMLIKDVIPSGSLMSILAVPFTPLIVGAVGGSLYMLKRNKDYKKVFNNLNDKLGEDALEEDLDKRYEDALQEQRNLESIITTKISDISSIAVKLQENKRYLEAYITDGENKKEGLDDFKEYNNIDVKTYTEKYFEGNEQEEYVEESLLSDTEEKGPKLIKRKKQ